MKAPGNARQSNYSADACREGIGMSSRSRFERNKIDVLDMLINILKSHEENLSEFAERLDTSINNISLSHGNIAKLNQIIDQENISDIVDKLDVFVDNISSIVGNLKEFTSRNGQRLAIIDCKRWSEFKETSMGTSLVAFEVDMWNVLSVTSVGQKFIFRYSEKLPASKNDVIAEDSIYGELLTPDTLRLRRWLSEELNIPEQKIIEGNLLKTPGNTSDGALLNT